MDKPLFDFTASDFSALARDLLGWKDAIFAEESFEGAHRVFLSQVLPEGAGIFTGSGKDRQEAFRDLVERILGYLSGQSRQEFRELWEIEMKRESLYEALRKSAWGLEKLRVLLGIPNSDQF